MISTGPAGCAHRAPIHLQCGYIGGHASGPFIVGTLQGDNMDLPISPVSVGDKFTYAGAPYIVHSIWRREDGDQWDLAGIQRLDTGQNCTWNLASVGMVLANPDYYK